MMDLLRDTTFGQVARLAAGNKVFLYPDERDGFQCPTAYREAPDEKAVGGGGAAVRRASSSASSATAVDDYRDDRAAAERAQDERNVDVEKHTEPPAKKAQDDLEAHRDVDETPEPSPHEKALARGYVLVDWYGDDDQENPQNWTMSKKVFVAGVVSFLTFAVYIAAAIITPGTTNIVEEFGVSDVAASIVLAIYVLAYGTGPLIFSPLSEIPSLGRNPLYAWPMVVVTLLSIGTPLSPNFGALLVFRFLTGFLASPALATGGASMADIFPPVQIPYAFIGWSMAAVCGPAIGPTISTFAIAHFGTWRWSMWIQLIITGLATVIVFFLLPETSAPTILLRRAQRLRKMTGNAKLRSQSEIDQADMNLRAKLTDALVKPFEIAVKDPAVAFADLYIFLVYATYYLFFDSFPLVLEGIYGWDEKSNSLAFLVLVIFIGFAAFLYLVYYYLYGSKLPFDKPERRLDAALVACLLPPIGLFMHGWASRPDVSPYVGLLGIGIFGMGVYVIFQTLLFYIALSYGSYAASILAGNDFARSVGTAGIVVAGLPFYRNLGVAVADSILGGISVAFIPMMFFLWARGDRLRARSTFAA